LIVTGLTLTLFLLSIGLTAAYAGTGGPYDLTWSTIDGGGVTLSVGGVYTLAGTAGQPDAGVLAGGAFSLDSGFWDRREGDAGGYRIFLPFIVREP
jgi:hypothetical protein